MEKPALDMNIQPGMIDSHFHASVMQQKGMDSRDLIRTAVNRGLAGGLDAGLTPGDFIKRTDLLQGLHGIILSAGCYPSEVEKQPVPVLLSEMELLLSSEKGVCAVGEIGLDWHWNYGSRRDQKELFAGQLELAEQFNLPVIIHNREADRDIIDILKSVHLSRGGILHCFSSDYAAAKELLTLGMHISFAGNMTYKKNRELRETAGRIPPERVLLETDSPYLSPRQQRGKLNHPGHIGYTYETLAAVKNMEMTALIEQIQKNFTGLFFINAES